MADHYLMPDEIKHSVYDIDFKALWAAGYKYLIFDLDNTLVPWNDLNVGGRLRAWIEETRRLGFVSVIVSNNSSERLEPVARELGIPFVDRARKPAPISMQRGMAAIGAAPELTVVIGDQLLTDVRAAKTFGMHTVLVTPIDQREGPGTRINRVIENVILSNMGVDRP